MSFSSVRVRLVSLSSTMVLALLAWLLLAVAVTGCGEAPATERLWVADNLVQCNAFDEPYRECMLVSHLEGTLFRHLEGEIIGFTFEEGVTSLLEVEPVDEPGASWRLVRVVSTR